MFSYPQCGHPRFSCGTSSPHPGQITKSITNPLFDQPPAEPYAQRGPSPLARLGTLPWSFGLLPFFTGTAAVSALHIASPAENRACSSGVRSSGWMHSSRKRPSFVAMNTHVGALLQPGPLHRSGTTATIRSPNSSLMVRTFIFPHEAQPGHRHGRPEMKPPGAGHVRRYGCQPPPGTDAIDSPLLPGRG